MYIWYFPKLNKYKKKKERYSQEDFSFSSLLVQTKLCHVGLRYFLLCSNCGRLPNQQHVDQKPGKWQKPDCNILIRLVEIGLVYRFLIFKRERRERWKVQTALLVQTWVCHVGLSDLLLCSNCRPLPNKKPCRPKPRKLQKKQIETCWFFLFKFDLFIASNFRKGEKREVKSSDGFFFNRHDLCKQGFARLDWGTSSCVLIVGPTQTKTMSTKNPENTKIQIEIYLFGPDL